MPANGTEILPPLLPISPEDHGAWVITMSTILLMVAALATSVTLISRVRILRSLTWTDTFLVAATILFILQTTCVNFASSNGIGKHRDTLSDVVFQSYNKFLCASQILSVIVLACSKAAVALLLISIKPFNTVLVACQVLLGLIGAWTMAFAITLAVQCAQPQLWNLNSNSHIDQEALYTGLAVCHILLDIALVALPMVLMCKVQMPQWKRLQICALFGLRVLVPALTIQHIVSLRPVFHSIPLDQPWHILMPTLWLQFIQGASIICTCIPSLKRALAELQTGMMAGTVSELFELSVSGAHGGMTDGYMPKPGGQSANATGHYGLDSGGGRKKHMKRLRPSNHRRMIEPSESMRDLRGSAIIQTVGYEVRWEASECSRSSTSGGISANHGDGLSGGQFSRSMLK